MSSTTLHPLALLGYLSIHLFLVSVVCCLQPGDLVATTYFSDNPDEVRFGGNTYLIVQ